MAKAIAIADYRHKLRNHDWSFEHSDDQNVWQKGWNERKELERLRARLDPDSAIWNSLAPDDYKKGGRK
jgi:hypothetical protein